MFTPPSVRSAPISLSPTAEGQVYGLFAVAMALTAVGVFLGMSFLPQLFALRFVLLLAQLGIVFTAGWWSRVSPLNALLFGLVPLFSGLTLAPFLLYVTTAYTNGFSILLNALLSTATMALAAAVFARSTRIDLSTWQRGLLFALLGFLAFALVQAFVPALRVGSWEILFSAAGIVLFSVFTAVDIQRIQRSGGLGASPFLLALSLYLDIYNLFLSVLRLMLAVSGNRRN